MHESTELHALIMGYREGSVKKQDLEVQVFLYAKKHLKLMQPRHWSRDDGMDYLMWAFPRLSQAIDNYKDNGTSFDGYIRSVVRWTAREYQARAAKHRMMERACWAAKAEENAVGEEAPGYGDEDGPGYRAAVLAPAAAGTAAGVEPAASAEHGTPAIIKNPRQTLYLLLKSYKHVTGSILDKAPALLDMDRDTLTGLLDAVREKRAARDDEINAMRERVFRQYYRCITFQHKIARAGEDNDYTERMRRDLEAAEKRLHSMRKRLAGCRTDASNRVVAEVLGISKGTVDASLHFLKRRRLVRGRPEGIG